MFHKFSFLKMRIIALKIKTQFFLTVSHTDVMYFDHTYPHFFSPHLFLFSENFPLPNTPCSYFSYFCVYVVREFTGVAWINMDMGSFVEA